MFPEADYGDAVELARTLAGTEGGVTKAVEAALSRARTLGRELGVFLALDEEGALERARLLDQGEARGPLHGVPIALKANYCVEGLESNCASRMLEGYRAPYTATAVQRLLDAGAVPIGMTNMDEFAMGSSSENSAFFPTKNPWDPGRTPGGSSSGSAVAVAAGIVPLALGSDTGGSVRQPAALCGTLGFKPTYGRVSRYGLIAFGSSLDVVSPFARTIRDLRLVAQLLAGTDGRDATALDSASKPDDAGMRGLRIGVPTQYMEADADVIGAVEQALGVLEAKGAVRVPIELPLTRFAIPTYYVVATAEASSNLARYDGVRYGLRSGGDRGLHEMFAESREAGFGDEVKRRILLGTFALSSGYHDEWYGRAQTVRRQLRDEFAIAFEGVDLIAGPTSPTPAFRLGERASDPVAMYRSDTLTTPASLAGLPALSLPCGTVERDGRELPVGLQLIGPHLADERVLDVGQAFEEASETCRARPPALTEPEGSGAR